ncbi:MAG: hypothetical protein WBR26_03330 [Candidatus Acidiferrum sp.]
MQIRADRLGLCSGCAGDYEDPDWTAWDQESEQDDEEDSGASQPPSPKGSLEQRDIPRG